MTAAESAENYDRLPDAVTEIFGEDATAEQAYELLTVDVPPTSWIAALETARDGLGCTYFDWLSAVDEPGTGFRVCAHVAALPAEGGSVRRLLVRTTVPHEAAVLPTAIGVYAGAAWHERETHEMFGIGFDGHPHLVPLLLPEGFEGHPLRKDFVLAARVAKAWPGAKEPGESEHGGPKRRTMLPPGVPDPNEWGPLKGQLPPAPARPARAARPAGDRPVRRTRSASDGSAGQQPSTTPTPDTSAPTATPPESVSATTPPEATAPEPASRPTPARRTRSASQGSASQERPVSAVAPSEAPAADAADAPESDATAVGAPVSDGPASDGPAVGAAVSDAPASDAPVSDAPVSDAPWHDPRPAFDEPSGASREPRDSGEPREPRASREPGDSQPLRRLRSGGPGAEPPVREGAGRGEAPRSGTSDDPNPEPPTEDTVSSDDTQHPDPEAPKPPTGGDPE
ncbi:NADH-quinone oxidoreductase subunit C [Streptomyces sp. NBC_01022]|uniref:NADH-quinone oxidoreductase subunit C n=1 Tax=Streptomyces sp. NBC_01022 TaxID=2903723 RepID=UPI002DDA608A|nr:NADH-quinone oxidoreductase subunit C [Streptomyces sp. NBC_01022]WRZ83702.1 NADH-quinone oxidoreductase subunit C [Streptomyces sp. NBC_01022]